MSLVKKIPSGYLLTGQGEVRSVCCQRHKLYKMYLFFCTCLLVYLYTCVYCLFCTCILVFLCTCTQAAIDVLATLILHIHSILFVHQPVIMYVALYSHVILYSYLYVTHTMCIHKWQSTSTCVFTCDCVRVFCTCKLTCVSVS